MLDSKGYVHITDFGIAKNYALVNFTDTSGTIGYMAPEVLWGENHTYSVDYYALGIIAYEFILGYRPYMAKSKKALKEIMINTQVSINEKELPKGYSKSACDFINGLIQRRPVNRLGNGTIEEIKKHPWLKCINWKLLRDKKIEPPFKPRQGDNFDHKFCNSEIKINEDTQQKYKLIMENGQYDNCFKDFNSKLKIPSEFNKKINVNNDGSYDCKENSQHKVNLNELSVKNNCHSNSILQHIYPKTSKYNGLRKESNINVHNYKKQRNLSQGDLSSSSEKTFIYQKLQGMKSIDNNNENYSILNNNSKHKLKLPLLYNRKECFFPSQKKLSLAKPSIIRLVNDTKINKKLMKNYSFVYKS